jgi:GlcNAc-P-P-Und epimerase
MHMMASAERRVLCTGGSGFIGSRYVAQSAGAGNSIVLNIDIRKPPSPAAERVWRKADILDAEELIRVVTDFSPTHLVHLAARTDMEGTSLDDYKENVEGTRNLLQAARAVPSLARLIITSSQHVRKPGSGPARSDEDFVPHFAYGLSKVITETLTRQAGLKCVWTIVRPTTVWGPGSLPFANGLWRTMAKGRYFHPRNDHVIRSYGYVDHVVSQINAILDAPAAAVDKKVFYLGDPCIAQAEWVNAFARSLTGHPARTVPKHVLFVIALVGELAKRVGLPAPLFLSRYRNLTTSNPVPLDAIVRLAGAGAYSLEEGVQETVRWLREVEIIH